MILTWMAMVKTLNRSRFTIDPEAFVLKHAPIWERGARFATHDIEGFDSFESRGRRGSTTWKVRVLTRDGKAMPVGLPVASLKVVSPPHWMPTSRV